MKKIKNKIARTINNFGKLIVFACLLLPSFAICCLLGSWTIDENGNLQSSNLCQELLQQGGWDTTTTPPSIVSSSSRVLDNEFISVQPNTTYTINVSNAYINIAINQLDINKAFVYDSSWQNSRYTFTTQSNVYFIILLFRKSNDSSIVSSDVGTVMLNLGSSPLPYEPYGTWYSSENYDSLYENYLTLQDDYSYLNIQYNDLQGQYDNLQQDYDSLEDQANGWYLEKRRLEEAYNQLANTIDNDIYSIDLVHYNSSDTLTDNYNVVYSIDDISDFIVSNSYLDFNAIKRFILSSTNPPINISNINGIIIKSSIDLSIAQYNMLFNAISSPEYYIGLYYSTKSTANQFVSYPLRVINDNGADYYFNSYSLYDVLKTQGFDNLFSDFTYNKLAIHLSNNNFQYFTINNIKLNSENGYNTGYSKGLLDSANTIASLQNNMNDLENQKIALNERINTLQRQLDDNLGWHSLFFSMADTPIKVVSGFLDYEILGINLFKALLGILTALAVLWLIKRFTR